MPVNSRIPVSNFGEDWTIKEIIRVTKEEASQNLRNLIQKGGAGITIVGNPVVTTIIGVEKP